MTFSQPSSGGDTFEPKAHLGRLLLIYPKAYDPAMKTKASVDPTPATDADIIVVDETDPQTGKPKFYSGARLFGNLAKSTRFLVENDGSPKKYLGRLGQGEPSPGRTAPWILQAWTDADAALAAPADATYQAGQFSAPVNPMAPPAAPAAPAAPQWQAPPPAAAPPQWQPPAPSAAPAPAPVAAPGPTAPAAIDPNLVAFLAQRGVTLPPGTDQATAEAIARSFPQ